MENVERILELFKEETAVPSIVLTTERRENIAIPDSKFGGVPYWPKDYAYPTCSRGNPLKLLAQLNFAQLPALENFPVSGILQFYVLPDESVGLQGWPSPTKQDTFRVVYHKEILPEESRMTDFPEITWVGEYAEELFPFKGEFLLKGKIANCSMPFSSYEFDDVFLMFCQKQNIESYFEPYFADWQELKKSMTKSEFKEFDRTQRKMQKLVWTSFSGEATHQISGHPYFIQKDPRSFDDSIKKYDTLLLAIGSEYGEDDNKNIQEEDEIMWGDAGVANFLINSEDLKNLDFSDVLYTWDCG